MKPLTSILLGAVLMTVASSTAIAGPSTEFLLRRAKKDSTVATETAPTMKCAKCANVALWDVRRELPNGRSTPRLVRAGTKHTCTACGGAITVRNNEVDNQMHANCATCAETAMTCCKPQAAAPVS